MQFGCSLYISRKRFYLRHVGVRIETLTKNESECCALPSSNCRHLCDVPQHMELWSYITGRMSNAVGLVNRLCANECESSLLLGGWVNVNVVVPVAS